MTTNRVALPGHWRNCPACGYRNEESEPRCEKCGRRIQDLNLVQGPAAPPPASTSRPTGKKGKARFDENLRQQLSARVQNYRSRQLNPTLPLPWDEAPEPEPKVIAIPVVTPERERLARPAVRRPKRSAPPPVQQPVLDFPQPPPRTEPAIVPKVAGVRLRMAGHAIDAALNLAAFLAFLASMWLAAGTLVIDKFLLLGSGSALLLVSLLYGFLFLCLAGSTPGMKRMGLRLVNFDGIPAPARQRLWRLLGAVVSAGSFFLGFFWALADEETLSWHDRMSKTFLTADKR